MTLGANFPKAVVHALESGVAMSSSVPEIPSCITCAVDGGFTAKPVDNTVNGHLSFEAAMRLFLEADTSWRVIREHFSAMNGHLDLVIFERR